MSRLPKHSPRKKQERLDRLAITKEQLKQYKQMFCRDRFQNKYLKKYNRGWCQVGYSWSDELIYNHLMGKVTIGLFPADEIAYLMLDIDNHDPGKSPKVEHRCVAILKVFDTDPLVYTSSDSGGIRIIYFLDRKYRRQDVLIYAKQQLTDADLKVAPGNIEIMAANKGDRLPFGNGSHLVDLFDFEPRYDIDLAGKIMAAWSLYNGERLKIDYSGFSAPIGRGDKSDFNDSVSRFLTNGLPSPPETTNNALLKISWDLMARRGYSSKEAKRYLKNWIREHHNGHSNRLNAGKIQEIDDQIDRIVERFDSKRVEFQGLEQPKPGQRLRLREVERILGLVNGYKEQLAIFSLLQYVKRRGVLLNTSNVENSSKELLVTNIVSFLQTWTCEIPYIAFQKFPGFDKRQPANTLTKFFKIGLIKLWKNENRADGKCRTYKIFFNFDLDSEEVVSLDEGLQKLKSKEQLRSDYGRYRTERILNKRSMAYGCA